MIMIWLIVDHPSIQGVSATTIVNTYQYALSMYPRIAAQLIFHLRFTLNLVPFLSDTHVPGEATRFKPAPRGRSFSVGYLTWADDLILLSITVIADIISTVSAPRCFRSLTDAYLRPGPDRR